MPTSYTGPAMTLDNMRALGVRSIDTSHASILSNLCIQGTIVAMLKNARTGFFKAHVKARLDYGLRKFDEMNQFAGET